MGIVIAFPGKPNIKNDLAIRLWELALSGQRHGEEYRRLDAEMCRRKSNTDLTRPLRHG